MGKHTSKDRRKGSPDPRSAGHPQPALQNGREIFRKEAHFKISPKHPGRGRS